ncbi:MAG: right-handed parallel beta-helix repeat-containing protein, partial [Lachnospiraceae bacterium]|nr:right-handed parallel beta-helix repeat-containing protein [Lachnospiraceae bacterium]
NDQWKATWLYSAFGQGVSGSSKDCGYQKISDDSARVYDINGKGKLVPASTDGLSFYYTKVPSDQNFTLSADVNVNTWKYSNGQEGFGLMASDDIGENGEASVFWNNSYMASVTKVLYNYDKDKKSATDDTSFPQYTMKLGVGSQEKSGVTKENLAALNNNDTTVVNRDFTSKMSTLETAAGQSGKPAGTYNIVGKRDTSSAGAGPDLAQYTSFKLQIQKNNTGYFVSYTDPSGKTKTQKYYDTKALAKLDPDYVYAGIFASRNCDVTAKNISLTTRDPKEDAPAEKIEMKKITPSFKIVSPASANGSDYTLRLLSNYDGKVTVKNSSDEAVAFGEVHKGEVSRFPVKVEAGKNTFTAVSQPNEGYQPDKFSVLSNYKENTAKISVSYFKYDGDLIYVGPDGKGNGTKKSPASIYDAVKYAAPGQTIVLLPGHYDLKSGLMIPLGTNGTKDQPIKMIADPSENSRPVLDFSQAKDTIGLEIAGDYWYLSGFDVTNAPNGKDGIHVSGSFNTLDRIHAYHNGNTGIQISRIGEQQAKEEWPAHNLILNCTSYANADAGYEDADGFAAKLTIGEGNIFDGCIAYNNADDGWDLFAKPETGSIGSVTIQNCLAYGNGYGIDGTDEGNGNGFKMGGSSLSGHHRLVNSVAFNNKAKGIDSNSCPDIEIENSISYNNGGSNVALYTTDAKNTDFSA